MTITKRMVREAFDPVALRRICTMEEADFKAYGTRTELTPDRDGRERFYFHKENNSKILAVAHLDSVFEDRRCDIMDTSAGLVVYSPVLDDRLGAYVILELLPKLGITVDWLLTTGEEIGDSTAAEFETNNDYNWMFSFDRAGTDVVMYDYETPELAAMVESCSATVGVGIFSDISVMDFLGCAGLNWGVGYRDYHGRRSHAWLEDTFRMVNRFCKFFDMYADLSLPHRCWGTVDKYRYSSDFCLCGELLDKNDMCPDCDADKIDKIEMWERMMEEVG